MSVNKYQPHLLVIPEDDANRQLATGFALEVSNSRRMQVLPEAGGWGKVCEKFHLNHISSMKKYENRYIILLLDFDDREDRREKIMSTIPVELQSRVLLLGVQSEPEKLKADGLGALEDIGMSLAKECRDRRREIWAHDLLKGNLDEVARLENDLHEILFGA